MDAERCENTGCAYKREGAAIMEKAAQLLHLHMTNKIN